jgi:hypothetical protein
MYDFFAWFQADEYLEILFVLLDLIFGCYFGVGGCLQFESNYDWLGPTRPQQESNRTKTLRNPLKNCIYFLLISL